MERYVDGKKNPGGDNALAPACWQPRIWNVDIFIQMLVAPLVVLAWIAMRHSGVRRWLAGMLALLQSKVAYWVLFVMTCSLGVFWNLLFLYECEHDLTARQREIVEAFLMQYGVILMIISGALLGMSHQRHKHAPTWLVLVPMTLAFSPWITIGLSMFLVMARFWR